MVVVSHLFLYYKKNFQGALRLDQSQCSLFNKCKFYGPNYENERITCISMIILERVSGIIFS